MPIFDQLRPNIIPALLSENLDRTRPTVQTWLDRGTLAHVANSPIPHYLLDHFLLILENKPSAEQLLRDLSTLAALVDSPLQIVEACEEGETFIGLPYLYLYLYWKILTENAIPVDPIIPPSLASANSLHLQLNASESSQFAPTNIPDRTRKEHLLSVEEEYALFFVLRRLNEANSSFNNQQISELEHELRKAFTIMLCEQIYLNVPSGKTVKQSVIDAIHSGDEDNIIELIIQLNTGLVKSIASKIYYQQTNILDRAITLDELEQEGFIAVFKAIPHFNPARGNTFAAYAGSAIRNAIMDRVRRRTLESNENMLNIDEPVNDTGLTLEETIEQDSPRAESSLDNKELREILEKAIIQLSYQNNGPYFCYILVRLWDLPFSMLPTSAGNSLLAINSLPEITKTCLKSNCFPKSKRATSQKSILEGFARNPTDVATELGLQPYQFRKHFTIALQFLRNFLHKNGYGEIV